MAIKSTVAAKTKKRLLRERDVFTLPDISDVVAGFADCTPREAGEALAEFLYDDVEANGITMYEVNFHGGLCQLLDPDEQVRAFTKVYESNWWQPRLDEHHGYLGAADAARWGVDVETAKGYALRAFLELGVSSEPDPDEFVAALRTVKELSRARVAGAREKSMTFLKEVESGRTGPSVAPKLVAERSELPTYLDPNHPNHSKQLAAAVYAWEAVSNLPPSGKHPKQVIMDWLNANARKYGLLNADGTPSKEGIDNCAKVANWQKKGGSPRTPRR